MRPGREELQLQGAHHFSELGYRYWLQISVVKSSWSRRSARLKANAREPSGLCYWMPRSRGPHSTSRPQAAPGARAGQEGSAAALSLGWHLEVSGIILASPFGEVPQVDSILFPLMTKWSIFSGAWLPSCTFFVEVSF